MRSMEKVAAEIISKIRSMMSEGGVVRVLVRDNDTTILSVPMDEGIAENRLGAVVPVWELMFSAIVSAGPDCIVAVEKSDGSAHLVYTNLN